jgi:hypothetical protein
VRLGDVAQERPAAKTGQYVAWCCEVEELSLSCSVAGPLGLTSGAVAKTTLSVHQMRGNPVCDHGAHKAVSIRANLIEVNTRQAHHHMGHVATLALLSNHHVYSLTLVC